MIYNDLNSFNSLQKELKFIDIFLIKLEFYD